MPGPLTLGIAFAESFVLYSLLRYFDVKSTRKLAERLDLQKHEANPLLTLLARRWGLERAFLTTWLVTASGIAVADTFLNITVSWGIPAIALLLGTSHLLAAASNMELEYRTRNMSREQIEAETFRLAEQLSGLDWKRRLSFVTERSAFNAVVTAISLSIIFLYTLSDQVATITRSLNAGAVMTNMALVQVAALLLFFPAIFVGNVFWSRRLVKLYHSGGFEKPHETKQQYVDIPISIVEQALGLAKSNNATSIKLQLNSTESAKK